MQLPRSSSSTTWATSITELLGVLAFHCRQPRSARAVGRVTKAMLHWPMPPYRVTPRLGRQAAIGLGQRAQSLGLRRQPLPDVCAADAPGPVAASRAGQVHARGVVQAHDVLPARMQWRWSAARDSSISTAAAALRSWVRMVHRRHQLRNAYACASRAKALRAGRLLATPVLDRGLPAPGRGGGAARLHHDDAGARDRRERRADQVPGDVGAVGAQVCGDIGAVPRARAVCPPAHRRLVVVRACAGALGPVRVQGLTQPCASNARAPALPAGRDGDQQPRAFQKGPWGKGRFKPRARRRAPG